MWLTARLLVLAVCALQVQGCTRTYYIGAVEVDWNYAPHGNLAFKDQTTSNLITKCTVNRIGSTYTKVVYRQFEDATFSTQMESAPEMGIVGPTMRAEEGDTIKVVFKNMAFNLKRNLTVHPHGARYSKDDEGAMYLDNTTLADRGDDGIAPGQVYTYKWTVPENFAPTRDDDNCLPWAYHSHRRASKDVDTGLVGMLLTCKKGTLGPDGMRKDVAKEYPVYVDIAYEWNSWMYQRNLERCGQSCKLLAASLSTKFKTANQISHINGYLYGNLKMSIPANQRSVFYFFSLNNAMTGMHISGQSFTVNKRTEDSIPLYPATFVAAYTTPTYAGTWLMASRNDKPYRAGQVAFVEVTEEPKKPSKCNLRHRVALQLLHLGLKNKVFKWEQLYTLARRIRHEGSSEESKDRSSESRSDSSSEESKDKSSESRSDSSSEESKEESSSDRQYYLMIEDYTWDYGPSGLDLYNGGSLTATGTNSEIFFGTSKNRIGGKYLKARYAQYTSSKFCTRTHHRRADVHLGMLGPVLLAEEGETVEVHVKNTAQREYTFLPHGVQFPKSSEGYVYMDPETGKFGGLVVAPGKTVVYRFTVPKLGVDDTPCVVRSYLSAVDPVKDVNTGLVGPMLLCKKGQLGDKPKLPWIGHEPECAASWFNQHQHIFLNFMTIDENFSHYLMQNVQKTANPSAVDLKNALFYKANRKHAINGRMYGNLFGINMCRGGKVAWHMFGGEGQPDMHGVDFQGQTLTYMQDRVSAKVVVPGSAITLTSSPESVGNWSLACRTNSHFLTGMLTLYDVKECGGEAPEPFKMTGVKRTHYIAAQEVIWDYAPKTRSAISGRNFTNTAQEGYLFTVEFIGHLYKKAIYLEYTDDTFTTLKPRPENQKHLGIMGPLIEAEVGDQIEVVFFNNASRPYSIHPQGVSYTKANEGARYQDGAQDDKGNGVPPGEKYTYTWDVPESAGPSENDFSCVPWIYFSAVDSVKDMSSGLVGPLLVCQQGMLRNSSYLPHDVDAQMFMLYFMFDENLSHYYEENLAGANLTAAQLADPDFGESNELYGINGLVYGNLEGMVMDKGDTINWYILGLGGSKDFHPVHFHGQTFTYGKIRIHRGDVIEVFPATSFTVRMEATNVGTWLVHCHYADHVMGGMEATYTIRGEPDEDDD